MTRRPPSSPLFPSTPLFRPPCSGRPADGRLRPFHRPPRIGVEELDLRSAERGRVVIATRSEEHTSELQSQSNIVCRLLLEKKRKAGGASQSSRRRTGPARHG